MAGPEGKSLGSFERSNWPFQPPLERASKLRGKNVKAHGKAGEIEDLVVNLGSGRVRGVIVAQDGRRADEPKLTLPLARRGRSAATARRAGCSRRSAARTSPARVEADAQCLAARRIAR